MVRITNSFGGEMTVNEIIVNSSNSQISGTRTVDLSSTAAITGQTYNDDPSLTEAQKQVKMLFETPMAIAADGVKDIIIPVAPVSSSNKFTVTVKALYGGTAYAFKNTQTSGGSLDRNQLGYVPISLSASGVHTYENLVSTVDEYNAMVSTVNAATSGSLTYTIDGTIDFGGATVTPMVLQSGVTLTLNGIYDATLKDMRVGEIVSGSDSYCGMIKASNNNDVTITGITVENADLSGVTNGNPLRIGAFLSHATGSVNLSNCKVKNATFPGAITNTSNSSSYIGGFLGYLNSNSVTSSNISNCEIMQDGSHNITVTTVWGNMVLYFGGLAGNTTITSGINISHCNVKVESVSITGNNRDNGSS